MVNHNDKNRYAVAVGHIAIEWNYLEHDLQQIGHAYLSVEPDVAAHIFAFMGNVTKVEFISYLINKYEDNGALGDHLRHFLKMYNRLRGNRNVVEHGVPAVTDSGDYLGEIIKVDRRGDALPFAASRETLNEMLCDLQDARKYAAELKAWIADKKSGATTSGRRIESPPLPKRLNALPFREG